MERATEVKERAKENQGLSKSSWHNMKTNSKKYKETQNNEYKKIGGGGNPEKKKKGQI